MNSIWALSLKLNVPGAGRELAGLKATLLLCSH
eukprot:CAMPEP_0194758904 /NCGR_PEP_ID=MMETSP0323_2-20130528/12067_1 /TAXON_ID=2866 ORGANISM="Crypthecodinium cohnii, Strain Seligo" /NCGR_SAMPLE_ID=MMETSP0323_2 /ASSEMBLY_ACC=CAM_ASM_000346 /LENGTH=32 /DNA_ID= /DNA_START= /DNA_END= /DNA_ORIENTATION=